jgi:hypothetical protein
LILAFNTVAMGQNFGACRNGMALNKYGQPTRA